MKKLLLQTFRFGTALAILAVVVLIGWWVFSIVAGLGKAKKAVVTGIMGSAGVVNPEKVYEESKETPGFLDAVKLWAITARGRIFSNY